MHGSELLNIRHYLGKSQSQIAKLLCVSTKTVQSWEQGWRNIPPGIERQLLFLLSLKHQFNKNIKPCWIIKKCPDKWRENCSAWEFKSGQLCWFINGTFCEGAPENNWAKKIKKCRNCDVLKSRLPDL